MRSDWSVHYMNARGVLTPWIDPVEKALEEVARRAASLVPPITLDIQIETAATQGIPAYGHSGYAPRPGLMTLTLYPENENLARSLGEPLERMIAHELHHALRWDTVGYGDSLIGALVTEGLAGRFVHEIYDNAHEPWESMPDADILVAWANEAVRHANERNYDHGRWFFGTGDLPMHAGYKLGYALVETYELIRDTVPSKEIATPAAEFMGALSSLAAGKLGL